MSKKKLFDHINHIKFEQDKNYFDNLSREDRKSWSTFMILKFLSMDISLTNAMNYLNRYQSTLDDSEMYQFIINMIPTKNYNLKYLKNKKDKIDSEDIIDCMKQAYGCSDREAYEYYKILNQNEINHILKSFALKE